MPVFGLSGPFNEAGRKYMTDTNKRLQDESLVKNPFRGRVKPINKDCTEYVIIMDPIYPPYIPKIGAFWLGLIAVFTGFKFPWLYLPGLILLSSLFFWITPFYYIMLRAGLWKYKVKGKFRLIRQSDIIRKIVV